MEGRKRQGELVLVNTRDRQATVEVANDVQARHKAGIDLEWDFQLKKLIKW